MGVSLNFLQRIEYGAVKVIALIATFRKSHGVIRGDDLERAFDVTQDYMYCAFSITYFV